MTLKRMYVRCKRDIRYLVVMGILCATLMLSGFISNRHMVINVDGQQIELNTPYKVPANILNQAGVTALDTDEYIFSEDEQGNPVLTVNRAVSVEIEYNGTKEAIMTCQPTVGALMEEKGFVGNGYQINQGLDAAVVTGMVIKVTELPVASPQAAKKTVNTTHGEMAYKSCVAMEASAYLPTDGNGAGITATGTRAQRGVVAVDPNVIPLGTKVYIPGYGVAVAADTGGAIRGHKIDLCMESYGEAINFGRRAVSVYILN